MNASLASLQSPIKRRKLVYPIYDGNTLILNNTISQQEFFTKLVLSRFENKQLGVTLIDPFKET
jgi:hypothetical protein